MKHKNVLLINPWIYDFAAYDFWNKPVGLLSIGNTLNKAGFHTYLIDCMDRYQLPTKFRRDKKFGTGKFLRTPVDKPEILNHVPRKYCRYGLPVKSFMRKLNSIPAPDVVLITSGMTYWYDGVFFAIRLVRRKFPKTTIILGGIYATLCYDHADNFSGADYVISGQGEETALKLVCLLSGHKPLKYSTFSDTPAPTYDYYSTLASVPIITSLGCPFHCSFCASNLLFNSFIQRDTEQVIDEIRYFYSKRKVRNFAFYDDALLINQKKHLSVILTGVLKNDVRANFHTPNGIHPRELTLDLAQKMFKAKFETIRLSYETSNITRQKEMGFKVTDDALSDSVDFLEKAGYNRSDLGVYVIMGLPGQSVEEVLQSMLFVHSIGAKIFLSSFSPIPGTRDWKKSVDLYGLSEGLDPLLTNNTIYPLNRQDFTYTTFDKMRNFAKVLNFSLEQKINLIKTNELSRIMRDFIVQN